MARGFESKDVESQQAEAVDRGKPAVRTLTPEERAGDQKRRTLELSLLNLRAERASATHLAHRQMLDEAIRALEQQIRT